MSRWLPFVVLVLMGAAWGLTQPLTKIAVSTGYQHFGLLFWQSALLVIILGGILLVRGGGIPRHRDAIQVYLGVALTGSVVPAVCTYQAAVHLPSGVLSILLSSVPMLSLPLAVLLGMDKLETRRVIGLFLGLSGVALLVLPAQGVPGGLSGFWVGVALISSLFYAIEGNFVAKWGTAGLSAVQVLTGASIVSAAIALPFTLFSGQFINPFQTWAAPEFALVASSCAHAAAYTAYVWLVARAGAVFAAQVAYLVTLFGVGWAMVLLSESYSGWVWAAMCLMILGMLMVQPRLDRLAPVKSLRQNAR